MDNPFIVGHYYIRKTEINGVYGGNYQSGISVSRSTSFTFLFTGGEGHLRGYKDGWYGDVFRYYGEGQVGDMVMHKGNESLRSHIDSGQIVHLFQTHGKGNPVSYMGEFNCLSYDWDRARDKLGNDRKVIIFDLMQAGLESAEDISPATLNQPLEVLRKKAYEAFSESDPKIRQVIVRKRCNDVKAYALKRANGRCECCGVEAPFITKHGLPYLEVHHIRKLSDYGLDSPSNVAALTPNCHREIHQGLGGAKIDDKLSLKIANIEKGIQSIG